jgi:hypothetical protein
MAEVLHSHAAAALLRLAAPSKPVLWHQVQKGLQQQMTAVVPNGVHLLCLA